VQPGVAVPTQSARLANLQPEREHTQDGERPDILSRAHNRRRESSMPL
jgi:hypothetical protein